MEDKKVYATIELLRIVSDAIAGLEKLRGTKFSSHTFSQERFALCAQTAYEVENKVLNDLTTLLAKVKRVSPHEFDSKGLIEGFKEQEFKESRNLQWLLGNYFDPEDEDDLVDEDEI